MAYSEYENIRVVRPDGNVEWLAKHRYVAEQIVHRRLYHNEVVHHIDGNKKNNDINNLMIFRSNTDHLKYHNGAKLIDMQDGTFTCEDWFVVLTCKNCGKQFQTQNTNAKFCSDKCYSDYLRIPIKLDRKTLIYKLKRHSIREIAEECNVCASTIRVWIKKYNINLKKIKKIKPPKKIKKKYVNYTNLPIQMISLKEPYTEMHFKNFYDLTEYIKNNFNSCENDYTIRKNILRVLNGERKSFHKYTFKSKAYSREKRKVKESNEIAKIQNELNNFK